MNFKFEVEDRGRAIVDYSQEEEGLEMLKDNILVCLSRLSPEAHYGRKYYGDLYGQFIDANHPFREKEIVMFLGAAGVSASVGPWIEMFLGQVGQGNVDEVVFWLFPQDPELPGNDIYVEFASCGACYMCGGMTDYSGEGGRAYTWVRKVVGAASWAGDIPVRYYVAEEGSNHDFFIQQMYQSQGVK